MPQKYTTSTTGGKNAETGEFAYTITNTYTPEKTSVKARKVWVDGDNQDGLRPDSVTLQLYANDLPYGNAVAINKNDWAQVITWNDRHLLVRNMRQFPTPPGRLPEVSP